MSAASEAIWRGTSGPHNADIMLVGEAFGWEEEQEGRPFVGASGKELDRMLLEAGIPRITCFATNVVAARPPGNEMWHFFYPAKDSPVPPLRGLHPMPIVLEGIERLHEQIKAVRPKVIVALGNYALWALTNCTSHSTTSESGGRRVPSGIMEWRGSLWYADAAPAELSRTPLVPVIHPAAILRAWYNRAVTVHDLTERVRKQGLAGDWRANPPPTFWAPPTFDQAKAKLGEWLRACENGRKLRLMNDIETARGLITCIGFADSPHFAMCIPFIRATPGQPFDSWWTEAQERELCLLMRALLCHPNCLVEGQNYLYDTQYIQKYLGCTPNLHFDSMLAHHLLFPGTPKALDYLSSLYCKYHWFWKEDHKEWDARGRIEDLLAYNCVDVTRNYECNTELRRLIPIMGQEEQWREELEKNSLALSMMNRGIRIDTSKRAMLSLELAVAADDLAQWFNRILPQHIVSPGAKKGAVPWWQSPTQQKRFFIEELGLRMPTNRKTGRETFGKEGITVLKERHPEFVRLFDNLEQFRSIRVFHNTFVKADLDADQRMRCSFNTAGTETFRWSSSANAFGAGTNLQNIPKGEEE